MSLQMGGGCLDIPITGIGGGFSLSTYEACCSTPEEESLGCDGEVTLPPSRGLQYTVVTGSWGAGMTWA